MRIPEPIRRIAADLNGKTLPLKDALARLRAADAGKVWVVEQYHYIGLQVEHRGAKNHYRVICYK